MKLFRGFFLISFVLFSYKSADPMMSRFANSSKKQTQFQPRVTLRAFPCGQQRTFKGSFDFHEQLWIRKEQMRLLAKRMDCSSSETKRLINENHKSFTEEQIALWLLQKDIQNVLLDHFSDDERHSLGNFSKAPLWHAVNLNNTAAFEALLPLCEDEINVADDDRITLLIKALWHDNARMVKDLLKAGANPNTYYSEKRGGEEVFKVTPLRIAVEKRNLKLIKILLKYGAKVTFPYPEYKQELIALAKTGYPDYLFYGRECDSSDTCKIDKIVKLIVTADLESSKALIQAWYHKE